MNLSDIIIILVSIAVGVSGQLAYLLVVDHELVRGSKQKIKDLQAKLKGVAPGTIEYKTHMAEIMAENSRMFKQTMRPTFITFVPFLIVFIVMSSFFSYTPITAGTQFSSTLSGSVNATLFAQNSCMQFNGSNNMSVFSNQSSIQVNSVAGSSKTCIVQVAFANGTNTKINVTPLVGLNKPATFSSSGFAIKVVPDTLVVTTLPFSIPIIGNKLTWFWTYILLSFVCSITLNRLLVHYKLVA